MSMHPLALVFAFSAFAQFQHSPSSPTTHVPVKRHTLPKVDAEGLAFDGARPRSGSVEVPPGGVAGAKAAARLAPVRKAPPQDPYLWLEPIRSKRAMAWAAAESRKTTALLTTDPRNEALKEEIRAILMAKDKLPVPSMQGDWVYNFWQDAEHKRGLWRRTKLADYEGAAPSWETVLDLDKLGAAEKENWVWGGADCLPPAYQRCLISLSRGGKDAVVVREFDAAARAFVKDGFVVPEAKSSVGWRDQDHLWVGTDFGPGSMTDSGYSRVVKEWTRGTPLSQAKLVYEGRKTDVSDSVGTYFRPDGAVSLIERDKTFYTAERFVLDASGRQKALPLPEDVQFQTVFRGQALAVLRTPWKGAARTLPAGALISYPLDRLDAKDPQAEAQVVYSPDEHSALSDVSASKDRLYLDVLRDVKGEVLTADLVDGRWKLGQVALPAGGAASILDVDHFGDHVMAEYSDFLTPKTVYDIDEARPDAGPRAFRRQPERFNAKGLVAEQRFATSKDGTRVPYFLIHREGLKLDGSNPTLLYAYGGFEVSMTPNYHAALGKVWLEKGGVYAVANIRGGGEFGPRWHEAALKEHRQRAYDDFFAVAEDLIAAKITSPRRLGIMGGSNGGLLMGVAFTQRPDLFNAVDCQVPLLDMLRYPKIGAGASWMAEYGDPADPKMAAVLKSYSPYHNVKPGAKYPKILFTTSVDDDRVQPAHARKMAAKLKALGIPYLYFENTQGGHSTEANLEDLAKEEALEYTYLYKQLFDGR